MLGKKNYPQRIGKKKDRDNNITKVYSSPFLVSCKINYMYPYKVNFAIFRYKIWVFDKKNGQWLKSILNL